MSYSTSNTWTHARFVGLKKTQSLAGLVGRSFDCFDDAEAVLLSAPGLDGTELFRSEYEGTRSNKQPEHAKFNCKRLTSDVNPCTYALHVLRIAGAGSSHSKYRYRITKIVDNHTCAARLFDNDPPRESREANAARPTSSASRAPRVIAGRALPDVVLTEDEDIPLPDRKRAHTGRNPDKGKRRASRSPTPPSDAEPLMAKRAKPSAAKSKPAPPRVAAPERRTHRNRASSSPGPIVASSRSRQAESSVSLHSSTVQTPSRGTTASTKGTAGPHNVYNQKAEVKLAGMQARQVIELFSDSEEEDVKPVLKTEDTSLANLDISKDIRHFLALVGIHTKAEFLASGLKEGDMPYFRDQVKEWLAGSKAQSSKNAKAELERILEVLPLKRLFSSS